MNKIIINPGTEPVTNASEANAIVNIKHFIADCKAKNINCVRIPEQDYGEGRYAFLLWKNTFCHEIQMPGLPLAMVRYTNDKEQNIWHYPRLYVDDSSWIWCYALLNEDDFLQSED